MIKGNFEVKLKLNRQDVEDFCRKYQYSMHMIFDATYEYASARCCIINGFFTGFILACQSIEKILKSIYYIETEKKAGNLHDLYRLKEKLKKHRDYELEKYDSLFKELYKHYQSRYYDNPNGIKNKMISQEKLDEIDELWLSLVEILPMPVEVKYRSLPYVLLCEPKHEACRKWIMTYNNFLKNRIENIEKCYKEVLDHLYPSN